MRVRDIFVRRDGRREQWRVQPMGWMAAALLVILLASLTSGVWRTLAGPRLRITPTPLPTAVPTGSSGAAVRPTATSIVPGCPEDPALWTLVPYSPAGPSDERSSRLYTVDPPCVMEEVERAFARCMDLKAGRGRSWSPEDEERCYSTSGFTTLLGGEAVPALSPGWPAYGRCQEAVDQDGAPVTSADLQVVFYTISEDKRVADVLAINDLHPTVRTYDCETGELMQERPGDPARTAVIYYPLLYEEGRWRLGYRHDVAELVPSDRMEPVAAVERVRAAQARGR